MEKLESDTMKIERDENGKLTGIHISDGEGVAIVVIICIFTQFTIRLIQALVR